MRYFGRVFFACCSSVVLASCASFEMIHDPRFGAVSKEHLPTLIKSVQCELETFYTGNGKLRDALIQQRIALAKAHEKYTPLQTVLDFQHFDLDDEAYGAFALDIKVQDSLNAPGTSSSRNGSLSQVAGRTLYMSFSTEPGDLS